MPSLLSNRLGVPLFLTRVLHLKKLHMLNRGQGNGLSSCRFGCRLGCHLGTQLGARTALHIALPPRPAGGPNLIDSESSDDGVLLSARKEQVGDALHTRHYIAPHRYHEDPSAGTVPAGYHPINIAGIPCYSNQQPPTGTSLGECLPCARPARYF